MFVQNEENLPDFLSATSWIFWRSILAPARVIAGLFLAKLFVSNE